MSKTERLSQKMEKLLKELRANHHGPKLWLLTESQLAQYRDWQARRSLITDQYPPGKYYEALLNGSAAQLPELPADLERALQLSEQPTIPADATEQEAYSIWEAYIR